MKVYREHSKPITAAGAAMALAGVVILGLALSASSGVGQVILGALLLLVGSLTAAMYGEVRIDSSQVEIRLVPVPRRTIELSDITSVEPVDISPLRQYGGWGWRRRPHTTGLILSGGPGACLRLADGSRFVVSGRAGQALLAELG